MQQLTHIVIHLVTISNLIIRNRRNYLYAGRVRVSFEYHVQYQIYPGHARVSSFFNHLPTKTRIWVLLKLGKYFRLHLFFHKIIMAYISTVKLIALISKRYQWQTNTEHVIFYSCH